MSQSTRLLIGLAVVIMVVVGIALPGETASAWLLSSQQNPEHETGEQPGIQLVASTERGVVMAVNVPWDQMVITPVAVGNTDYMQVSIPGWNAASQPGAPELPSLATLIGVPFDVGFEVQVQPGKAHTQVLPAAVLPVATPQMNRAVPDIPDDAPAVPAIGDRFDEDPAIYEGTGAYPGPLAQVANDGIIRQQRVAGLVVSPVQYNPANRELTVYESLRIQVVFVKGTPGFQHQAAAGPESSIYEQELRQSLLNYESARAWRQAVAPESYQPAGGTPSGFVDGSGIESSNWAPPVPGWRIKVRSEGFYKLTYAELQAKGLPVNTLDPRTLRLYNLGNEAAIYVEGEADGNFGSNDYIIFYGQAIASKYTADNVYWLTYGGAIGLRIGSRDGTPGTAPQPTYYPAQRQLESNGWYRQTAPGSDDLERWLWDYVYPSSRPSWTNTFTLAAPYLGDYPAMLSVVLLGSLAADNIYPDHHIKISLNGTQVADVRWDGITWTTVQVPIAQSLLRVGSNTLYILAPNDTGLGYDYVFVDRYELSFANTFKAETNLLSFDYATSGTWKFQVDGFTSNQLAIYDVTNPLAPVLIQGASVTSTSPYTALFQDTLVAPTRYWAMATNTYRTVQAIEADTPSNLRSTTNGADHITIHHSQFASQAATLRDFRTSQGLRAISVDVQDVYDEFGYGLVGAAPVHDFLAYAYSNWVAPAPSFVVLVGDGHYDPKNYSGFGRVSFIPPYLAAADPFSIETAADNRYVTLAGADTFPDMMIGRLSVNNSTEASAFVNKIVAYEQTPILGDWQLQVLAIADNADSGGYFPNSSDALLNCCLPAPYQAQKVYYGLTHTTADAARAAILGGINTGVLVVNYIGHASNNLWAFENLFTNGDVAGLTNGGKLPVMLPMTCLDGYFIYPQTTSTFDALGEVVTRAEGKGAVASWSSSGKGVSTGHDLLDQGFFNAVFNDPDGVITLGEATTAGKLYLWGTGYNLDLVDTYLLFGDPATRVALPDSAAADLQINMAVSPAAQVYPGDALDYTLTVTNNGPGVATQIVLSDPLPAQLTNPQVTSASPEMILRAGTTFTWDIASLAAGQTATVTVRATVDPALIPPASITNTAQVSANEADPQAGNNSASVTTEVVAPVPTTVHVGDLDGYKSSENKKGWFATVTILVRDNFQNPVANATVSGNWSGGVTGASSCLTGSTGTCSTLSPKTPLSAASVTYTVTGVTHATLTYASSQNTETSILVYKDAPVNQPPVASFTYTCTELTCNFDGSASSDPDGTVVSYAWNFGDGGTGTGAVISHTFASAATYSVALTVIDNGGASGSQTQVVPVGVQPAAEIYVYDITMSGVVAGTNRNAVAIVTIHDTNGSPVEGATVSGAWSGAYSGSAQGITGADGTVTFTSGKVKKANSTFTFTVNNVTKAGSTYNPSLNLETSGTITVP